MLLLLALSLVATSFAAKDEKFYCFQKQDQKTIDQQAKYFKTKKIASKFKLEAIQNINLVDKYVRFYSSVGEQRYIIKMFLRKSNDEYFKQKDIYTIPGQECEQQTKLTETLQFTKTTTSKLETCEEESNILPDKTSDSYMFLVYKLAKGKTLSEYCIKEDCRFNLKQVLKYTLEALQKLNLQHYYLMDNLNADSIYYYKGLEDEYVTLTDIKYNQFPDYDQKKKIFDKDMEDLGKMLIQIVTQNCEFELTEKDRTTPLSIFLKVHAVSDYYKDDKDLQVDQFIYHQKPYFETGEEKIQYIEKSVYHFIWKSYKGVNQFADFQEAISHPYLIQSIE